MGTGTYKPEPGVGTTIYKTQLCDFEYTGPTVIVIGTGMQGVGKKKLSVFRIYSIYSRGQKGFVSTVKETVSRDF
jgi:hypothetical protein